MGPCFLSYHTTFCLSHRNTRWTMSVDYVGLKICLLGTSTSMVTLTFFPWCKRSDPWMSSTTNQHSYMALGWLHGPWCKQPLSRINFVCMPHEGWMKNGSLFAQKWMKIVAPIIGCLHSLLFVSFVSSLSPLCFGQHFVEAHPCWSLW